MGAGIFELLWGGLVVVGLSDYVIRPFLVGGHGHVPTLLTFISLFGGVEVFGLLGLIIGPVIASVALALLRTYDREMCVPVARRAALAAASNRFGTADSSKVREARAASG